MLLGHRTTRFAQRCAVRSTPTGCRHQVANLQHACGSQVACVQLGATCIGLEAAQGLGGHC